MFPLSASSLRGFHRSTRLHRKILGGLPKNVITFAHPLFQRNSPNLFKLFQKAGNGKQLGGPGKTEPSTRKAIVSIKTAIKKKPQPQTKQAIPRRPAEAQSLPVTSKPAVPPMHLCRLAPADQVASEHLVTSFSRPSLPLPGLGRDQALPAPMVSANAHTQRRVLGLTTASMLPVRVPSLGQPTHSGKMHYSRYRDFQLFSGGQVQENLLPSSNPYRSTTMLGQLSLEMAVAEASLARRRRMTAAMLATFPNGPTAGSAFGLP